VVANAAQAGALGVRLDAGATQVLIGPQGLERVSSHREADCVMAAIVGAAGLEQFECGALASTVGRSEMLYGIVGGVELTKSTTVMSELHGTSRMSFDRDVLSVNVGIRRKLTNQAILIASLGHEVRTPADQPLAFIGYCGVQLLY